MSKVTKKTFIINGKKYKGTYYKCHPNSGIGMEYNIYGFVCPFCGDKLILDIHEICDPIKERELRQSNNIHLSGYDTLFGCGNCGHTIATGWWGLGIKIEEIISRVIKDYESWECNKKNEKEK